MSSLTITMVNNGRPKSLYMQNREIDLLWNMVGEKLRWLPKHDWGGSGVRDGLPVYAVWVPKIWILSP